MIGLQELIQTLNKKLDQEIDTIMTKLLKKGVDSNAFITEQVRKGLQLLCYHCSDQKLFPVMFQQLGSMKSNQSKINICQCFETILDKNKNKIVQYKEFERIIQALASLVFDSNQDVRSISKKLLFEIQSYYLSVEEFDLLLKKILNENNYRQLHQIINKNQNLGKDTLIITNQTKILKDQSRIAKRIINTANT